MEYIKVFNNSVDADPDDQLLITIKYDEENNSRSGEVVTPEDTTDSDEHDATYDDPLGEEPVTTEELNHQKDEIDDFGWLSDDEDLFQDESNLLLKQSPTSSIRSKCDKPSIMANKKSRHKNGVQRTRWSEVNVMDLLDLWEQNIAEFRGTGKNSHIHKRMAEQMNNRGMTITGKDIKAKLDNLSRKYRVEKQKIGSSGGTLSNWPQYNRVHNIVGVYKPAMMESTDLSQLSSENSANANDASSSIDNVTTKNLHEKQKVGPSGRTQSNWTQYNRVHNIVGGHKPAILESTDLSQHSFDNAANTNDASSPIILQKERGAKPPTELPSRKRKNADVDEQEFRRRLLQLAEDRNRAITQLVGATLRMEKDMRSFLLGQNSNNNAT